MFYGRGAGDYPTASALVSDLVKASKAERHDLPSFPIEKEADAAIRICDDWMSTHFIRVRATDKPGVLAGIAGTFARYDVGIASMVQKGECDAQGRVQLVFLTHRASEKAVRQALAQMDEHSVRVESMIRAEGI